MGFLSLILNLFSLSMTTRKDISHLSLVIKENPMIDFSENQEMDTDFPLESN
jgi:hypothetical protein